MNPTGEGVADETKSASKAGGAKTETDPASGKSDAGLQVIVLGQSGGPWEDSVTGMLVRSTSTNWGPDSIIAVDAGTLLCGIKYVLESEGDNGPFAGMAMPHKTAKANAAHILRETVGTVLVTHAHLDHISGFVLNSQILEASNRPKRLAALPSVIAAFKDHIFNGVIWPNLTDEDDGAGLFTFQRLAEGGSRDEERGYVRACEGLMTQCFAVSHGRRKLEHQQQDTTPTPDMHSVRQSMPSSADRTMSQLDDPTPFVPSLSPAPGQAPSSRSPREVPEMVESSAFFIRDRSSGKEIIIFGDVEPDSVSAYPRNRRVWEMAAPKIISGALRAIFIECSYDDSVKDENLYGHLNPRHLIAELKVLAQLVTKLKHGADRKRKRSPSPTGEGAADEPSSSRVCTRSQTKSKTSPVVLIENSSSSLVADEDDGIGWSEQEKPLVGLHIYPIHIKDDINEKECVVDRIWSQFDVRANFEDLGCLVCVPRRGEEILI
ncbi:3',5'-cyclic-nucleotide phosphodiesterase PDE1 [Aspergillus melleus]|uniref:3',5'-cyclic-nucleotide phosphodiesterase PDE1 n=1 Tax=Aspergillus melleus TaxID=138277 RepID=UPI001E8D85AC|nr:3',5'-cyclic-nucleotide phosphodiesterase pde1 [Aspergillus melleus]KAH8432281.1 3',5'-cyclic-nucleotide phosphodiesterase pde1 [Aspergillus melleus]